LSRISRTNGLVLHIKTELLTANTNKMHSDFGWLNVCTFKHAAQRPHDGLVLAGADAGQRGIILAICKDARRQMEQ